MNLKNESRFERRAVSTKRIRGKLGLHPHTKIIYKVEGNRLVVKPIPSLEEVLKEPPSLEITLKESRGFRKNIPAPDLENTFRYDVSSVSDRHVSEGF